MFPALPEIISKQPTSNRKRRTRKLRRSSQRSTSRGSMRTRKRRKRSRTSRLCSNSSSSSRGEEVMASRIGKNNINKKHRLRKLMKMRMIVAICRKKEEHLSTHKIMKAVAEVEGEVDSRNWKCSSSSLAETGAKGNNSKKSPTNLSRMTRRRSMTMKAMNNTTRRTISSSNNNNSNSVDRKQPKGEESHHSSSQAAKIKCRPRSKKQCKRRSRVNTSTPLQRSFPRWSRTRPSLKT